jgi:hypothetical protein
MTYDWGKLAAVKAFNKFKEGSVIGSNFIMKQGLKILMDSIEDALDKKDVFSSLAGLSEFWKHVSSSEISTERLTSMPKEFQTVLSKEKIIAGQKVKIPRSFKPLLKDLKEIVHVGELMYKRKTEEDTSGFVRKSKVILSRCRNDLGLEESG